MLFYPALSWTTQWSVMLTTIIGYFVVIFGLRAWMKDREAMKLNGILKIYNAFQVVLCFYCAVGLMVSNFTLSNPFGLNTELSESTEWFVFVHYLSKYADLLDTVWIVLKKNDRQLSFLHLYHHTSILAIWGFLLQIKQGSGTVYFGATINSWIHVMMYSHYLITSYGFRNPLKPYLTMAQIGQMWICLFHAMLAVYFETVIDHNLGKLQACYHVTMIVLFTQFYFSTYGKGEDEKKKAVVSSADIKRKSSNKDK